MSIVLGCNLLITETLWKEISGGSIIMQSPYNNNLWKGIHLAVVLYTFRKVAVIGWWHCNNYARCIPSQGLLLYVGDNGSVRCNGLQRLLL